MNDLRKTHTQICTGKRPPSDKQIRQLLEYAVKDANFTLHKSKDKNSPELRAQPLAMGALHELERRFPGKLAPVATKFLREAATSDQSLLSEIHLMKLPEELARLVLNYEASNHSISEAGLKCLTTLHELKLEAEDNDKLNCDKKPNFGPAKNFIMPFFKKALGCSRKALTSLIRLARSDEESTIRQMARDALTTLYKHGQKNAPALEKALRLAAFEVEGNEDFSQKQAFKYVKDNYMDLSKASEFDDVNIDQIEREKVLYSLDQSGLT